ncbi:hypothetical protein PRNP1_005759 [Phytophthora ramorum]
MTSSKKIQSFAAGQSDGKRFLRSHKNIDFDGHQDQPNPRDYMKLDDNWTKEVHNLYNEYARLHKASGQYP